MPIIVGCRCGQRFQALDELAGKVVSCPACRQPLAIPAASAPTVGGGPLDLGDLSRFEQSAAVSAPRGVAGGAPRQYSVPAYAARRSPPDEGLSRWLIVAMCGAAGVVLLAVAAILLSPLWTDSGNGSREPRAGEVAAKTAPPKTPAQPPADGAAAMTETGARTPAAASPASRTETGVAGGRPEPPASGPSTSATPANTSAPGKPPTPTRPSVPQPGAVSIKLSAGTALAQTLPTGTAMGFSIDYEFLSGRPDPSAEYSWVIKSSDGRTVKQPVQLQPRGTLQGFVLDFRPEHGPFQTSLEDAKGRKLTEFAPLR